MCVCVSTCICICVHVHIYVCIILCDLFRLIQLATGLTGLAESFDQFHETGMQHFQAANGVVQKLKGIASLCQNDSGNTITTHIEQV